MRPDGSGKKRLTHNDVQDCCLRVSGDGTTLYFRPGPAKAAENQAMNVDGSNARRIADRALVAIPNISPDGRY